MIIRRTLAELTVAATTTLALAATAACSGTNGAASELPDARLKGDWAGRAKIIVTWCEQEQLDLHLVIHEDASVTGTVGDAVLVDGRVKRNRGAVGEALNVKTDFIIQGELHGPVVAAEDIARDGVNIPFMLEDDALQGAVHTTGWHIGPPDKMVLTAPFEALSRELTDFGATVETLTPRRLGTVARLHVLDGIAFASQPSPDDLRRFEQAGLVTVLNLRHPEEMDFDEAGMVHAARLTYHSVPWNGPDELTDDVFDEVREMLRTAERPLLFHCSSANRVGANWLPYRVLDQGLSWEQALKEARAMGMRTEAYPVLARDYIDRRAAEEGSGPSGE